MSNLGSFIKGATATICLSAALVSTSAHASLIVTDAEQFISTATSSNPMVSIDVNNDSFADVRFSIESGEAFGPFDAYENGLVRGLEVNEFDDNENVVARTSLTFSSDGESFNQFALGDTIGADDFIDTNLSSGMLYNLDVFNTSLWLQNIGDTGFLGFRLTSYNNSYDPQEFFYGFIEVTRGSLSINTIGFQGLAGASLQVTNTLTNSSPDVEASAPATLGILVMTFLGLAFIRRRAK
jgi:hypothetical protein